MCIYYTAYITTNLVNGKKYAGVHKTIDPCDRYVGSGSILKQAIAKYGREHFLKEVIHLFESENDMYSWESTFVNQEIVDDPMWYNIRTGGSGGFRVHSDVRRRMSESRKGRPGKPHTAETKRKLSIAAKGRKPGRPGWNRGQKSSIETRTLLSKVNQERYQKMTREERSLKYGRSGEQNGFFGRAHTEEFRQKISQTASTELYCDHCGVTVNRINYYRYHGENCGTDNNSCICEYCGFTTTPGNHKRWHGGKCKHKVS